MLIMQTRRRRARAQITYTLVDLPMKTLDEIREIIQANMVANRPTYEGLTSNEIASHSRVLMFGENDAAFPSQEEWSAIVD